MINSRMALAREFLKLTQKGIAEKAGIHLRTYARYESPDGGREIPASVLSVFAQAGINVNWLLTGEGEMFIGDKSEGQPSVAVTTAPNPPDNESGQGIVLERGEGPNKTRMVLPPTAETYAFLREQWALEQSN
jgi:transcriptional regulator with XRE-family HTH domain